MHKRLSRQIKGGLRITLNVSVTEVLDGRPSDPSFVLLTIRASRETERTLGVNDLLCLRELWHNEVVNAASLAPLLQKGG